MQLGKAVFEWPQQRPDMKPFRWALDGGGRQLIINLINQHGWQTMVEVGVYCGGSVLQWLEGCPDLHVFGVDPYSADANVGAYYASQREFYRGKVDFGAQTEFEFVASMSAPDSLFPAVLSNLWDYRARFTPVRGYSPQALIDLAATGVTPELIFLDAMKTGEELPVISDLWPQCVIAGDDWTWIDNNGRQPIREAVYRFAAGKGCSVIVKDATWLLEPHARQIL